MISAEMIRAKITPSIDWSFTLDGLKIMRSAKKRAKGTDGKVEIYNAMEERYKIFTQNPAVNVFSPFTLQKADFLADVLPAVYWDAIQRFWFEDRPENAKYVTAALSIINELDARLRQYIDQNTPPLTPGIPNPPPGSPFQPIPDPLNPPAGVIPPGGLPQTPDPAPVPGGNNKLLTTAVYALATFLILKTI